MNEQALLPWDEIVGLEMEDFGIGALTMNYHYNNEWGHQRIHNMLFFGYNMPAAIIDDLWQGALSSAGNNIYDSPMRQYDYRVANDEVVGEYGYRRLEDGLLHFGYGRYSKPNLIWFSCRLYGELDLIGIFIRKLNLAYNEGGIGWAYRHEYYYGTYHYGLVSILVVRFGDEYYFLSPAYFDDEISIEEFRDSLRVFVNNYSEHKNYPANWADFYHYIGDIEDFIMHIYRTSGYWWWLWMMWGWWSWWGWRSWIDYYSWSANVILDHNGVALVYPKLELRDGWFDANAENWYRRYLDFAFEGGKLRLKPQPAAHRIQPMSVTFDRGFLRISHVDDPVGFLNSI